MIDDVRRMFGAIIGVGFTWPPIGGAHAIGCSRIADGEPVGALKSLADVSSDEAMSIDAPST